MIDLKWQIVSCIVLFLATLLWIYLKRGSSKHSPSVVLCGPSESGKTAILLRLVRGVHMESQTSQSVNQVSLKVGGKSISVVDTPGNFRLLPDSMKYIESAKSLIFVVDSSDKQSFKMAAQLLVDIALNPRVIASRPRMLFLANKSDMLGSRDVESVLHFVQLDAERILKAYKSESHMKQIPSESMPILHMLTQADFTIDKTPLHVTLGSCSALQGSLDDLLNFIG